MLIKRTRPSDATEAQVTDEAAFTDRRRLLKSLGFLGAQPLISTSTNAGVFDWLSGEPKDNEAFKTQPLSFQSAPSKPDSITDEYKATHHNNFYEFGLSKSDPSKNAQSFKVNPWQLDISGEVNKPLSLNYDDLFTQSLEERIYRLRCVEAWSMVIPWIGFPLANLLKKVAPNSKAKYVAFETLQDPKQMPSQRRGRYSGGIQYPYIEGLRMDEAMHPLTFVAVGVYGKTLPPQNGAPVRLIVPWKYGFKSIKSIVSIRLQAKQPNTTWNLSAPREYGFYANVNPNVDHPRWSQAYERRIISGGLGSDRRIATQPFNGYGDQVAALYSDMDLRRFF